MRIDHCSLPTSVAHIKVADFIKWRDDDSYVAAFRRLRSALGVTVRPTVEAERQVVRLHFTQLLAAKELADTSAQLMFQLERLWFVFNKDRGDLCNWFTESARNSASLPASLTTSRMAIEVLSRVTQSADPRSLPTVERLVERLKELEVNHVYFLSRSNDSDETLYARIWQAENQAIATSALLRSFLTDALLPEPRSESR